MLKTLRHRGPDHGDIWQDPDIPIVLAHRRLAIIDLSPEGHQPMASASGRYVIVYNGEIYNFPELRSNLESAGIAFRGRSDTEVILAAIEVWGLNQTLQKINGMFSFGLWDRKDRRLHFARDRLGKKPLYVGWADGALVFASELKALRADPDFKPAIDPDALNLFLRYGYIPAPHCIYRNIWTLPAGFRLSLETESLEAGAPLDTKMEPYWHHLRVLESARTKLHDGSDEAITDEFEALLTACTKDRMISDVPLGAFLSGGIDSSTIVALMQKTASGPVKTYSIGFHEAGFDEAVYAKKVAAHLGTDHHELYLSGEDALGTIPLLPDIYDEPFADISAIPTYLVSKFAQADVTVALSGDGGDEMLGGYNRHFQGPKIWKRMRMMPKPLRRAMAKTISSISTQRWDRIGKGRPQFGNAMHKAAGILSLDTQEQIYGRLLSTWPQAPMIEELSPDTLFKNPDWQVRGDLNFTEKMMYWDALTYLPNDILVKVDRASMAVSLEARAPLLDRRIYEYVWSLPEKYKVRGGQGKWLLRQVLKRHVPAELFERPKQGFNMPVGEWLRGPLKDWAENLLGEKALQEQGLLDAAKIREVWNAHQQGRGNHADQLWTILMFQSWQERWL